jgi:hypothetical protein
MTLDGVANFINLTVSEGYDENAYVIGVESGGATLPAAPFNVIYWNSTDYPSPDKDPDVEIDRVISVVGNVITLANNGTSRTAQEGTTASAKNTPSKTYSLMLGITAKMIADISNNLQKPWRLVTVNGAIDGSNVTFTLNGSIAPFDPNSLQLSLARQPQLQGIDYTFSGTTITYVTPPVVELAGQPHICQYQ